MKTNDEIAPAFLTGGGQMGELIRSFDWSATAIGMPGTWPESLRIAVRIMLDTPFGMYIAWGNEFIQLYNDGYRPILGATKHPQALGGSTRETFAEIWPTIGPMFAGVMEGTPIGFPDFILHLDRHGFLEECVFDFAYSPIRLENGEVGGVLVTVIETTEKVKAARAIKESEQELQFAIEATELGTWDLDPATNKFRGNSRLKAWFGLMPDEEIGLPLALAIIADKDREKVTAAIQTALQFSSGGHYDIIYTIIHPQTKIERIVRAKGQASFNAAGIAYRFNGTLQDVTKEIVASRLLIESEQRLGNERRVLYNSFMNAPAAIAIVKGDTHIYEFANTEYEKIVDRKIIIGKTVQELFPELAHQGLVDILDQVFSTGEPFIANEFPVELINKRTGQPVLGYYNSVLQPMMGEKGNTERLLSHGVDVTQQVEARKQIEESQQRFSMLADSIPNLAWMGYADGNIFWYNKKWFEYTGTQLADMEGWGWQSVHDPEKLPDVLTKWQASIETGQPFEMVFPLKGADGKFRQFLTRILPVVDSKNKIYRWFGTSTDISEQIEAEERIKESEAKFRTLAETIPHLVWTATPDGKKDFFNKHFLNYTGLSSEALKADGWHAIIFPDDLEKELAQWHQSLKTGEDFKIEKRIRNYNGTYRWHLCHSIAQKDNQGNITGWIGTNTDITEQKTFTEELEKQVKERTYQLHIQNETFKQAEESSLQGSYSFNLTTGKLTYSDNLYRLIGCEPNEFEPSLEQFDKYVHPDDRDYVSHAAQKVLQSKKADEWHYRMHTKSGKAINIKGTGRVIESGDEKLLVGTLQDITKDVLAAEALKEKNLALEDSNIELASFSYIASHDLKEPLRKIQVFSSRIIETENFSDRTQDYFKRIIKAAERMRNLIDSLLDFSHVNTTEVIFESCDLNVLVDEVVNDLLINISEKDATIEHENLPVITGVRVQILQLISNLLDNAIKYSRPAIKPHIKITAAMIDGKQLEHPLADKHKEYYAIKIADNGIGFEKEYVNKIFELFQRLHSKHEYSGTGIGLAIVKKIVSNHNGFIKAEGALNVGATFTIYIPTA